MNMNWKREQVMNVCMAAARASMIACALASACMIGGCNIVGPVVAVAAGPPKVEARHTLANVPTVVFIDDRKNLVSPTNLRRAIADRATQELMLNELVTTTINPQDAILIASRSDKASDLMDIEAVGRAVGAHQVIYVQITMFAETPDGFTPVPTAAANVKVIDVTNHQRVFPGNDMADGYPVKHSGAPVDPSLYASRPTRQKINESLASELGDQIAKLFYKHEYVDLGERLTPR